LLMMAFAAGCLRVRKAWKGGLTAGSTLGLYGLGLIGAGIFGAGPMADFPPATDRTAGILPANDLLHFAFGGTGFLGLIAGALILGIRFIRAGRWGRAGFSILTGLFFAYAFMGIASGPPTSAAMIAFYVAVLLGWGWIASLSNWMLGDLRDGAHARSIA
ncbi:MAG: DUF998 domain-containing protein, partial [Flavobacteriales bacterium]|nr:DUF998 domain-containing protein [Flavobacteriales bacterium]